MTSALAPFPTSMCRHQTMAKLTTLRRFLRAPVTFARRGFPILYHLLILPATMLEVLTRQPPQELRIRPTGSNLTIPIRRWSDLRYRTTNLAYTTLPHPRSNLSTIRLIALLRVSRRLHSGSFRRVVRLLSQRRGAGQLPP